MLKNNMEERYIKAKQALFDKKYSYNVRGRNDRDVEHLIIHNLKRPQTSIDNFME